MCNKNKTMLIAVKKTNNNKKNLINQKKIITIKT